jgi:hypothetical protein
VVAAEVVNEIQFLENQQEVVVLAVEVLGVWEATLELLVQVLQVAVVAVVALVAYQT